MIPNNFDHKVMGRNRADFSIYSQYNPVGIDFGNNKKKSEGLQHYKYRVYSHQPYSYCQEELQMFSEVFMAQKRTHDVDHGYAWIILLAAFFNQLVLFGCIGSFPILFVEWNECFVEASKSYIASVGAVNSGAFFLVGPLSTFLSKRFDGRLIIVCGTIISSLGVLASSFASQVWHLHVLYSLCMGVGCGITSVPLTSTVGLYFSRYRTFALAMCFAGGGFGMMLFPPLTQYLIHIYTWRGALIVLSALNLNMMVFGSLLRPVVFPPSSSTTSPRSSTASSHHSPHSSPANSPSKTTPTNSLLRHTTDKSVESKPEPTDSSEHRQYAILSRPSYWLLVSSTTLWFVGALAVLMLLNDLAVVNGLGKEDAAILMSTCGLSNAVGRIVAAILGSNSRVDVCKLYNTATLVHGVATLLYVIPTRSYTLYTVFTLIFGLSYGVKLALVTAVMVKLYGVENLPVAFGFSMFVAGIGTLLGPTLTAWLFDETGNYQLSFGFGGGVTLISVLIFVFVLSRQRAEEIREEEKMEEKEKKNRPMEYVIVERITVL